MLELNLVGNGCLTVTVVLKLFFWSFAMRSLDFLAFLMFFFVLEFSTRTLQQFGRWRWTGEYTYFQSDWKVSFYIFLQTSVVVKFGIITVYLLGLCSTICEAIFRLFIFSNKALNERYVSRQFVIRSYVEIKLPMVDIINILRFTHRNSHMRKLCISFDYRFYVR